MRGAIAVTAVLLAVASNAHGQQPAQTVYVQAPFEAVWGATIEFFANSRVPISTIDKASGLVVAKDLQLTSDLFKRWATCHVKQDVPLHIKRGLGRATTDFNVFLRGAGDSTALRVNAGIRAEIVNPLLGRPFQFVPVNCEGNGTFDRELTEYIAAHAKATP